MIASIPIKMWLWKRDEPNDDTWSIIYWQPGKTTGGLWTTLTDALTDAHDPVLKENGFQVMSRSYNPVDMPENERAKYFSLDAV